MADGPRPAPRARVAIVAAVALAALGGCAGPTRQPAVPQALQSEAQVVGMPGVRYRVSDIGPMVRDYTESLQRERALRAAAGLTGPLPPADFLAVSGGGENGAFGAGLLLGWEAAGTRPDFKLVTGVSTGALIAPFAFLGKAYDPVLREVYTGTDSADVLEERPFTAALWDDAMTDNAPLRRLVARHVDERLLAAVRAEHAKGRILLIATTDLDAREPVIWNMGKLAASGHPGALQLFRDVMVASAAIPGAFPPMMVDVEAGGRRFQEMHVDGGTSAQVFLYPPSIDLDAVLRRERRAWIIRNGRFDSDWAETDRRTLSIVARSITSLIQNQGVGDLYRIYAVTQRDHVAFNLAYIPHDFDVPLARPFDRDYMTALFNRGYAMGAAGYRWLDHPPTRVELRGESGKPAP